MSKKTTLYISGVIAVGLFVVGLFGTYKICSDNERCINLLHSFFIHFLPFIPLFLFSLVTYKMRDEVYRAWLRFAYVWVPLSMVLIFLAPEYSTDWMYPVVKGTVASFTSLLFVIISLVIITWKSIAIRRTS